MTIPDMPKPLEEEISQMIADGRRGRAARRIEDVMGWPFPDCIDWTLARFPPPAPPPIPPCHYCGELLKMNLAKQCLACGMDWHDPNNVRRLGQGIATENQGFAPMTTQFTLRHWPRFSLRTLFVVVTLACCWCGYQLNWIRERHGIAEDPQVSVGWYNPEFPLIMPGYEDKAPWTLQLFGERRAVWVVVWTKSMHPGPDWRERIPEIQRLFPEALIMDR